MLLAQENSVLCKKISFYGFFLLTYAQNAFFCFYG